MFLASFTLSYEVARNLNLVFTQSLGVFGFLTCSRYGAAATRARVESLMAHMSTSSAARDDTNRRDHDDDDDMHCRDHDDDDECGWLHVGGGVDGVDAHGKKMGRENKSKQQRASRGGRQQQHQQQRPQQVLLSPHRMLAGFPGGAVQVRGCTRCASS